MSEDNKDFVTKADLELFLATIDQKLSKRDEILLKEFDVRENKIHSSYAKKLKAVDKSAEEEVEETPNRRATKRELEQQASIEKLIKELEDNKARASAAERFKKVNDAYLKAGINPKASDMLYRLHTAEQLFTEDELGNVAMKVAVDGGALVNLPLDNALKHFVKSDQGQLFLAPSGASGSGAKLPVSQQTPTNKTNKGDVPLYRAVIGQDVDWSGVAESMKQ